MNKLKQQQMEFEHRVRADYPVANRFDAFRESPEYRALVAACLGIHICEVEGHIKISKKKHDCLEEVRAVLESIGAL